MEPEALPSLKTSKKAAKKEAAKAAKLSRRQETVAASTTASGSAGHVSVDGPDPLAANYGDIPYEDLQSSKAVSGRVWTTVKSLTEELKDRNVLIRGRIHETQGKGKRLAFWIVRESGYTVQCVLSVPKEITSEMVTYATGISNESFVDVEGVVTLPHKPIKCTTQKVEIQVRKIHCVDRAETVLPINIKDASRRDVDIQEDLKAGVPVVRVNQDTRLTNRVLDLRTPAYLSIFRVKSQVKKLFRKFLEKEDFLEIETPTLIAGTSEGGAAVFRVDYHKQAACLAQSPQLHKQMAICTDSSRVFVVSSIYRAENSNTHRHLCEFTGLDFEMVIKEHYSEVMDMVEYVFVNMFDKLNERCKEDLEAIRKQHPFTPLKYLRKTLRLTFEEGVQMLKDAGIEVDPLGDLNTESERTLGKLVLEKYGTEFYILHRFPLAVRPFYTMPCPDNKLYSNSFDVFIRGEEIISGSQRIHRREHLEARANACGIDVESISSYINAFRYGVLPHGGMGAGLERVVMLFLGLDNIRKTSYFPRDPRRLEP